jgi:hypothetical protein
MFTRPADLAEDALAEALTRRWQFVPTALEYQPVGFGSHHWLAANAEGARLFLTVDDLAARLRTADDTTDAALGRLRRAFATALSLRADAGLEFVVAPMPASDGQVLARLADRYSLAVHPYTVGTQIGPDGEFTGGSDRTAVLDMVIRLHRACRQAGDRRLCRAAPGRAPVDHERTRPHLAERPVRGAFPRTAAGACR